MADSLPSKLDIHRAIVDQILSQEYETQHFGFHPRSFTDGVYKIVYDYLQDSFDSLIERLTEQCSHLLPKDVIQSRTESVFVTVVEKLDKIIDKLELFLQCNVFYIPEHVVLPEDRIHVTNPISKEQMEQLDSEIEELTKKVKQARVQKVLLKRKLQEQKEVKEKLLEAKNMLELPISEANKCGIVDLQESACFFMEKALESCEVFKKFEKFVNQAIKDQEDKASQQG